MVIAIIILVLGGLIDTLLVLGCHKLENEMEERKNMMRTCYICDGKKCKNPLYCKVKNPKNWLCAHTTDPEHAVNGPVNDPWNHLDRFKKEEEGRNIYYTEKLPEEMKGADDE